MTTSRQKMLVALGLIILVWAVFGQAMHFGWVRYDDNDYVYRSGEVTSGLTLHNITWAFTHIHAHNWHPLTTLSLMMDCQLFGVNPPAHHTINIIFHLLAAIALFLAIDSLTGQLWRSAFVAAVFAIHPLRVESVAWIAERKDVLSGLFFALTLFAWASFARKETAWRYLLALLFAALGVLSKPMLVTIPFVLLLIDYWPLQRFGKTSIIRLLLERVPFLLFAAASATGTLLAQGKTIGTMGYPLSLRMENAVVSSAIYLRQLLWPADLAVLYPHPEEFFPARIFISCGLLVAGVSVIAVFLRKRLPFLFTGWFWYAGMLIPVIGIVQVGRQGHADRYTYLPLVGVIIAVTWLGANLIARLRFKKTVATFASGCVIVALTACAQHQTTYWQNSDTLWTHTLAVTTDNDGAHLAFATTLFAEGRTEEAIAHMQEAARLRPSNAGVFGEAPLPTDEKQIDAGLLIWSQRVEERPDDVNAHNSFGVLLVQKHQTRAAIVQWEKSLQLSPQDGNAQADLAWVLATAPDDALRDGRRAVTLAEGAMQLAGGANPILFRTLAAAYAEAGRFDDAISAAERGRALSAREGNRILADQLKANIAAYEKHLPLRDPSLQASD